MTYEATMIINGHQPIHIGNYSNKEIMMAKVIYKRERGKRMIEDKNFILYITMKSGIKYMFKVSGTELDWLFDKMFERESGSFQNFGTNEELEIGMRANVKQAETTLETARIQRGIDFEEYWKEAIIAY